MCEVGNIYAAAVEREELSWRAGLRRKINKVSTVFETLEENSFFSLDIGRRRFLLHRLRMVIFSLTSLEFIRDDALK